MLFKKFRTSFTFRVLSVYLALSLLFPPGTLYNAYALTGGPSQPEFNSFTPIATSDMVNLSSGDFNYNIPIMDVGGYPINLSYNSGVTMDQEASWVGLGWNLNVGQIVRNVHGLPDDFKGDKLKYEDELKDNISVGARFIAHPALLGSDSGTDGNSTGSNSNTSSSTESDSNLSPMTRSLTAEYNNYEGISLTPSLGIGFKLSEKVSVGFNITASTTQGVNVSPTVSLNSKIEGKENVDLNLTNSVGTSFNSRQGISSFTLSSSVTKREEKTSTNKSVSSGEQANEHNISGSISRGISFAANTFTPTKRTAFLTQNYALSAAIGAEFWGLEFDGEIYAFGSKQSLIDNVSYEKSYGYEHTEIASYNDILDFNRENDRSIGKHTKSLSITNYTYDTYSINGQGISGMFRPYKGQVGYVYDRKITDKSIDSDFGLEFGGGAGTHFGVDVQFALSKSSTGIWENNNYALHNFESTTNNSGDYERTYFKTYGELIVDPETDLLYGDQQGQIGVLGGDMPIRLGITKGNSYKYIRKTISGGYLAGTGVSDIVNTNSFNIIKRNQRLLRNQSIQKITKREAQLYKSSIKINSAAKNHHTAAFSVLKPDGSTYVFGETAYNLKKEEATFDVSGGNPNLATELVSYSGNPVTPSAHSDKYLNRVTTPPYAHTYMLTEVLSTDYEDINGNGPDPKDLGSYTKITYRKGNNENLYKWRVPYERNMATFNEGLKSINGDNKGSYIYGEKEILYIDKIETKTHIAVFYMSPRKDAFGVQDNRGGLSENSYLEKIDKIVLFSKKDYDLNSENATPIKTAYFEYDYSLCQGVPNNNGTTILEENEQDNQGGKLTLKKVYFTYKNSYMGKFTPYKFDYGNVAFDYDGNGLLDDVSNPNYDIKGYDMWGNYKPNIGLNNNNIPSNAEFPYVQQTDRELQDYYATAWNLTSIDLPSGGNMVISYESDDYAYVQDKKVMQMYQVVGAGGKTPNNDPILYNIISESEYLHIKIEDPNLTIEDFTQSYLGDLIEKDNPIYFRFLLNMRNNKSDFVTGYFKIDKTKLDNIIISNDSSDGISLVSIPMKMVNMEGGVLGGNLVNPISKAGWYFGRKYLNRMMYSLTGNNTSFNFEDVVGEILNVLPNLFSILSGPNLQLRQKSVASTFDPNRSWIRLYHAKNRKLGGGVRVNKIQIFDNWDKMTNNEGNFLYKQYYGQEYTYNTENGHSSGVATFEPNISKENPFVEPYYDTDIDKFLAPSEENYVERPFGASFFPAPTITYERVTVRNLKREEGEESVIKHATGFVENIFYTSKDFPTISEHTPISSPKNYDASALGQFLNLYVRQHFTVSQGFVVRTNDMNGKSKSQKVFNEAGTEISGVDYIYQYDNKELNNIFPVIDDDGNISQKTIGVTYDVINDFRESKSTTTTLGLDMNVAVLFFFIPVPVPFAKPNLSQFENILRTAITTKVIHKTGVLKKKIAYDLGASISTENLAWDAETGQIVVTKTVNEYDDAYYTMNYLAHTHDNYKGMKAASHNLGLTGYLTETSGRFFESSEGNESEFLTPGDEMITYIIDDEGSISNNEVLWVINKDESNRVILMNRNGNIVNDCSNQRISKLFFKVMRSGYRNLQTASMQSITSMINPVYDNGSLRASVPSFQYSSPNNTIYNPTVERVINASAIEYSDFWQVQKEVKLPYFVVDSSIYNSETNKVNEDNLLLKLDKYNINPYLYNIRGNWRAKRSWAYLGGRYQNANVSPRNDGFFTKFSPFYTFNSNGLPNRTDWTFASEVSLYSPFGVELENRDALGRYSSAQYDFLYTLPSAVASNAAYRQIGYDGFEDIDYINNLSYYNTHFRFNRYIGSGGISNLDAHTGNNSMAVKPNTKLSMLKTLNDCESLNIIEDCQYCENPLCDYPDCDCVDLNFTISNISKNCNECSFSLSFTINGYPGQITQYKVGSTVYTVKLDEDGKKNVNITSGVSGGGCYPDDATYGVSIIVSDLDGNILVSQSCQFYCGSGC